MQQQLTSTMTDQPPSNAEETPSPPKTQNETTTTNKLQSSTNETFTMPPPPPSTTPPTTTTTPNTYAPSPKLNNFFSRMSSLGSSAAPILEQVYDRAHKRAVEFKEGRAANGVGDGENGESGGENGEGGGGERDKKGGDATDEIKEELHEGTQTKNNAQAQEIEDNGQDKEKEDEDDENEKEADDSSDAESSASVSSSSYEDPPSTAAIKSPMRAVMGAYTEFRTTGRYARKTENAESGASAREGSKGAKEGGNKVVGGADQIGGLGRLKLINFIRKDDDNQNAEAANTSATTDDAKKADATKEKETSLNNYKRKTSTSYYEAAIANLLAPNQRALFFGRGTMGVILKPTYLASWRGRDGGSLVYNKRGGVFIDALVPGGHAERSGVVFVGDAVVKVGNVDVRHKTLEEVVRVIDESERPCILVLMAEWDVDVRTFKEGDGNGCGVEKKYFVSPCDLAFGFVNLIAEEGVDGKKALLDNNDKEEEDKDSEEVLFTSDSMDGDKLPLNHTSSSDESSTTEIMSNTSPSKFDTPSNTSPNKPNTPSNLTNSEVEKLLLHATQRTNAHPSTLPTTLARAAFLNANFRSALHEAFKECCVDLRKCNFLHHFYQEYGVEKLKKSEKNGKHSNGKHINGKNKAHNGNSKSAEDENDPSSPTNQLKLLEIYLELCAYASEATVCCQKQLLERARGIASRFLGDDFNSNGIGSTYSNGNSSNGIESNISEYIAHLAIGTENLSSLRRALNDEDEFFQHPNGDGFYSIRQELGVFLSMQEVFLAFLISDDCARMRAYLRGCLGFCSVEPGVLLDTTNNANDGVSSGFLFYAILHLVCMKEASNHIETSDEYGNFIKMDTMVLNQRSGKRVAGAASILSCPIFVRRTLNKSLKEAAEGLVEDEMMGSSDNLFLYEKLGRDVQLLWENYLSPICGGLALCTLSNDTKYVLDSVRSFVASSLNLSVMQGKIDHISPSPALAKSLTSEEFSTALQTLCDALIQDYCQTLFPNFRRHIFHEWALAEATSNPLESDAVTKINDYLISAEVNPLPKGYSKKALRQIELPRGLSSHLPGSKRPALTEDDSSDSMSSYLRNADVAVVFSKQASDDDLPKAGSDLSSDSIAAHSNIHRHACGSLLPDMQDATPSNVLALADIPDSFEEYMGSPPFRDRPFKGMLRKEENSRMSLDGWEVSLANVMIPVGKGSSDMLYCVSLTLSNIDSPAPTCTSDVDNANCPIEELCHESNDEGAQTDSIPPQCKARSFQSPLFVASSEEKSIRKMKVSCELSKFNQKLKDQIISSKSNDQKQMIGISLASRRNVIPAMRQTLSLFFEDLCSVKSNAASIAHGSPKHICQPLVDLLSVFTCKSVEEMSLKCILEPYISYSASPWIDRPLLDQSKQMVEFCGMQVLQSLPPVPLALLFVTALLEQKILFSSSRRAMLMSASVVMSQLIKPLNWTHLLVPHAPISMINDLIHYPAPFILGLSTDEKQSATILRSLPAEVTLVDLDVGRVMLASVFVNDDASLDEDKESSQSALRSQALILAEFLGGIFGSAIYRESWCSESPFNVIPCEMAQLSPSYEFSRFSTIQMICHEFVQELISGISSCCLWIEESINGGADDNPLNPSIVFDEDLFMHIKNCPAHSLNQLNLGQFNLILQAFLRTQSLSSLISASDKNISLFS